MTEETRSDGPEPPRRRDVGLVPTAASMGLPSRFGPYAVLGHLGRGGMGAVLRVRHEQLGAVYALKVVADAVVDAPLLARFQREMEVLGALSGHPNIVKVHASGTEAGRPWYVMDLVEGAPLDAFLEAGPLSIPAALRLGAQVAKGLAAAHERGILHRDVKPANVLVVGDPETADVRAVLCDFGLAAVRGQTLTKTGELLGTPAFMAPEQALGEREKQGPATDIFSLASVVYYALTREHPYVPSSASGMGILTALLGEKIRPPRRFRPEIPEALDALLVRCLDKEPAGRPQSALEVARAFEAILEGKREKPPRRLPLALLVGAVVLGGGAAFFVLRGGGPAVPPPPPSPPSTPPPPVPVAPPREVVRAERLQAARKLLGKRGFAAALEAALGDDIPEGESDDLAALVREGALRATDDVERAKAAIAGARAGLDLEPLLPELAAREDDAYQALFAAPKDEPTKARERWLRLALLCVESGRKLPPDRFEVLRPVPPEQGSYMDRVDRGGWLGDLPPPATAEDRLAVARAHARSGKPDERGAASAEVDAIEKRLSAEERRSAAEALELARIELLVAADPPKAVERLGAATNESLSRQLLRAAAEAALARGADDEHAAAARAIWTGLVRQEMAKKEGARDDYLATAAYYWMCELELRLGKPNRARAWFARGRVALGGGGRSFDDLSERIFR